MTQHSVAVFTILNGVLLDVMPEIGAALTISAFCHLPLERRDPDTLLAMVRHFHLSSGLPPREKLRLYNQSAAEPIHREPEILTLYAKLRATLLDSAVPAPGIEGLLRELVARSVSVYTTSVMPQSDVDLFMRGSPAGARLAPLLTGCLGERPEGTKLEGHLRMRTSSRSRFYLLLDAPSEIGMAAALPADISRRSVGIFRTTSSAQFSEALARAASMAPPHFGLSVNLWDLDFDPGGGDAAAMALSAAGADTVIDAGRAGWENAVLEDLTRYIGHAE